MLISTSNLPTLPQNDSDMYREGGELYKVLLIKNPTSATVDFPTVTHGFVSHHDLTGNVFLQSIYIIYTITTAVKVSKLLVLNTIIVYDLVCIFMFK